MTIIFEEDDRRTIAGKLEALKLPATEENINRTIEMIDGAFKQQLDSEADYMLDWLLINEFEEATQ